MTVTAKILVAPVLVLASQHTQYTAPPGVTTIIDKFTVTNYSTSAANISVNLITLADTAGNQNLVVQTKTLQAGETYTFPEIVGQILNPGGFISTLAGTVTTLSMVVGGREITS